MTGYCQLRIIPITRLTACLPHPLIHGTRLATRDVGVHHLSNSRHTHCSRVPCTEVPASSSAAPYCYPPRQPRGAREALGDALCTSILPAPEATSSQVALFGLPPLSSPWTRGGRVVMTVQLCHYAPELSFLSCLRHYTGWE